MMRAWDIEQVLRWAYREELPKAVSRADHGPATVRPGWAKVESYAQLLTVIDENMFGVVPNLAEIGWPHADAMLVHDAVVGLDELVIDLPDGWAPIADLGDLGTDGAAYAARALDKATLRDAAGERRLKGSLARLMMRHAILGGCPAWEIDPPTRRYEVGANGRPRWFRRALVAQDTVDGGQVQVEVVIDGFNARRGRPYPDAYRKAYLDPDPTLGLMGRVEYEVWHAGLGLLYEALRDEMESIHLQPSPRPARPWETPYAPLPRVLESSENPVPVQSVRGRRRRRNAVSA